jgi:hypothetical protein
MQHNLDNKIAVCTTADNAFIILNSTCIAVKDRKSKTWAEDHYAIGERVSLVPKSRTNNELRSWKLVVFTFGCRVETGAVLAVSHLSPDEWDYVYRSSRYRHLVLFLIDNALECEEPSLKRTDSRILFDCEANPIRNEKCGAAHLECRNRAT